jgi:tyrosyl-tRNA synthetase
MAKLTAPVEEQMRVLMSGVEYGDANIQRTMAEELRERLAYGKPLRVYCGFDPTAVDLHLGHLIPMLKLRQFQRFGHEVTFLIGTMTGIVGDPSDKTAARQMLTAEEVEANAQTWLRQAYRVLEPEKTIVKRNGDWLAPLTLAEVVQLASHFTVGQFLDHETFRTRLAEGKPLYVHEFIYALMQAYDALHLKTDVQVGGVEQLFNIMAGRQLQRALGERPLVAVCLPILIGTDGQLRMSKSTGNYISLDAPPADMYGKVMSIPDSLTASYSTLVLGLTGEEAAALLRDLGPMAAKKRLAHGIVALLYDETAADAAQSEFERVFQRREEPEEAEELLLPLGPDGKMTLDITAVLARQSAVVSRNEARRLLNQGAIAVDGRTVSEHEVELREGSVIRVGRHRFLRVVRG